MAYATLGEVEARLGFTLNESEAQAVTYFLEDLSTFIDVLFEQQGITPSATQLDRAGLVVARKARDWYLGASSRQAGVTSQTETVGDTSVSITYSESVTEDAFRSLSTQDKIMLGLRRSQIINFTTVRGTY
jgi:hypothetical protein